MQDDGFSTKTKIILGIILVVDCVAAFIIGQAIGVRSRIVLYTLVFIEVIIGMVIVGFINHFKK